MASRNVGCFLGLRKLMKANTEQLACWRRSDSRARRSDGRGELHCTPGKRGGGGGGGTRGECESGYCLNAWKRLPSNIKELLISKTSGLYVHMSMFFKSIATSIVM